MDIEHKFRILIIDDSKVERQKLRQILKETEYIVYEADGGLLGIAFANQFIPDLILCDIIMPGIDGFVTCKRLKENKETAHIPVVFISGQAELQDKVTGFQVGGIDYITKPYEPLEVILRIRNHLNLVYANKSLKNMNEQLKNLLDIQTRNLVKAERQTVFAQFFQGVVHNLKAPLSSISGYSEINNVLLSSDQADNMHEMLIRNNNIIIESAKNVVEMINSILQRGRDNVSENKEKLDLNELILKELKFLEANLIYKTRITKNIHLLPQKIMINVIPSMISQSIQNLLKNAIDAMYDIDNARLEIETSIQNNKAILNITDNGLGIQEELFDRIFEPFFTTKPESTSESNSAPTGTGLGLFICKEMIETNHGKIRLKSSPNQGTSFIVELPLLNE